jgi:protein LTV1
MGKKKSFIDRKNASSFRLMHRSQKDPLIADDDAGEHVLHPIGDKKTAEELHKYGVYFEDDYDYLQHLRDVNEVVETDGVERTQIRLPKAAVQLPSTIFETKGVELKVGLLNQAAPRNELLPAGIDPDIAAALEGDADFGEEDFDELEDDFIAMANADDGEAPMAQSTSDSRNGQADVMKRFGLIRERHSSEEDDSEDDEEMNDMHGANEDMSGDEEDDRKTRFSNYSMTSAVIKRPDGLQLIDEHFETLFEEYDEENIGECEVEEGQEIVGFVEPDSDRFQELVKEFQQSKGAPVTLDKPDEQIKKLALEAYRKEQKKGEELEEITVEAPGSKRGRWDCESVLSTYTNIYNHPTLIREEPKRKGGLTKKDLKELEQMDDAVSVMSGYSVSTLRPKGETAEERKVRKTAIKEERRERRQEKKANKDAFKQEKKHMDSLRTQPNIPARPLK